MRGAFRLLRQIRAEGERCGLSRRNKERNKKFDNLENTLDLVAAVKYFDCESVTTTIQLTN